MRILIVMLFAAAIGGCQCAVPVSASGSLERGITFAFPETRAVYYAGVKVRGASREWKAIWRIEGKDRVQQIRYGEGTRGLSVKIVAPGLQRGHLYQFSVEARDGLGMSCIGGFTFVIDAEGSVQECGEGYECRRGLL